MRSIFNFISFPGIADQGGGSEKVLSFSMDYSPGQNANKDCNAEAKKVKNLKIFVKIDFSSNLNQIHQKSIEYQIKIDLSDS